MSILICIKFTY